MSYTWNHTVCKLMGLAVLSVVLLSSLWIVACIDSVFLCKAEWHFTAWACNSLCNYSLLEGYLIVSIVALLQMKVLRMFPCRLLCGRDSPFSVINAQEHDSSCMFSFLRNCRMIFYGICTILCVHCRCVSNMVSLHLHQHLVWSLFHFSYSDT